MSSDERYLTRQGQDRKAELLRCAEALFEQRGYQATRMIDIAREAGVTKGLVYWYFENKEAIFRDIVLDVRERLRKAQREALDPETDPLTRVYVGTFVSVRFVAERHRLYGLFANVAGDPGVADELARATRVHADDAAALMREGQRMDVIRSDEDAHVLAGGSAGVVNHFAHMHITGQLGGDLDDVAHYAATFAVRAVAANDAVADAVIADQRPRAARRRRPRSA